MTSGITYTPRELASLAATRAQRKPRSEAIALIYKDFRNALYSLGYGEAVAILEKLEDEEKQGHP
jgi:hypothetical protein